MKEIFMARRNSSKTKDPPPHDAEASSSSSPCSLNHQLTDVETLVGELKENMVGVQTSMAGMYQANSRNWEAVYQSAPSSTTYCNIQENSKKTEDNH